jgi:hypothetical protein
VPTESHEPRVCSVSAGFDVSNKYEQDTKNAALNSYAYENQEAVNKCLARILNQEGQYAKPLSKGLSLENGRSISTSGLWMTYWTNCYNATYDPVIRELLREEIDTAKIFLTSVYAMYAYLNDRLGTKENKIDTIFSDSLKVDFKKSDLVHKFFNGPHTEKMQNISFSVCANEAENNIQKSLFYFSIGDRKRTNILM